MKTYLLRIAGLTALVLSLQFSGFAQTDEDHDSTVKKFGDNDEIVIKPKTDVDVKLNVEIKKDGQVLVNGKPMNEFDDKNVSVRKRRSWSWMAAAFPSGDWMTRAIMMN